MHNIGAQEGINKNTTSCILRDNLASLRVAKEPRSPLWLLTFLSCSRVLSAGKDDRSVSCNAVGVCISASAAERFGNAGTAKGKVGGLGDVSGADLGCLEALFDGGELSFESESIN